MEQGVYGDMICILTYTYTHIFVRRASGYLYIFTNTYLPSIYGIYIIASGRHLIYIYIYIFTYIAYISYMYLKRKASANLRAN